MLIRFYILFFFIIRLSPIIKAQTVFTDTLYPVNQYFASGTVTKEGKNTNGDLVDLSSLPYDPGAPTNCGFVIFDLKKIPEGASIQGATVQLSSFDNKICGDNATLGKAVELKLNPIYGNHLTQAEIKKGITLADGMDWTGSILTPSIGAFTPTGITAVQAKIGATLGLGIVPPDASCNTKGFSGYSSKTSKPFMTINYIISTKPKPSPDFYVNRLDTFPTYPINFFDNSGNSPTSWLWDFGDGKTSTEKNPSHAFTDLGKYTIVLKANNAQGQGTITKTDYINIIKPAKPIPNFIVDETNPKVNDYVYFINQTKGFAPNYLWDFGDGNFSTDKHTENIYKNPGKYTVKLIAIGPYESDSIIKIDYINVGIDSTPVIANFGFTFATTKTINYIDSSINNPSIWSWDFGDGENSTQRSPKHTYASSGEYKVCLIAQNLVSVDTLCKNVSISSTYIKNNNSKNLSVYYNTSNRSINIFNSSENAIQGKVFMYDDLGRAIIYNQNLLSNTIDLKNIKNGFYIVQILDHKNIFTKSLIIY